MKKIAIIGSGISGLTCAHYLQHRFDVTVFEANDYVGGHTATKTVTVEEGTFAIDTGFIVFNDWTYPNFERLLNELGIGRLATEMGFSVSCEQSGLEYSGGSVSQLFAQRKNLFSVKHWRLIRDILHFNKQSKALLESGALSEAMTLKEYIEHLGLSNHFAEKYLVPMGAAIWSSGLVKMYEFPALYFLRFFKNHGLLNVNERPQWYVVPGGSQRYVDALLEKGEFTVELNAEVTAVAPKGEGVAITVNDEIREFDEVIFACHSNQAHALLDEPLPEHHQVLGNLKYQANEVVLHTDESLLPKAKSTWSSWNYRLKEGSEQIATLTYSMNILQRLDCETEFCVTLNDTASIDPEKTLGIYHYDHPVYTKGTLAAQQQRHLINGKQHLWFCGAYWYAGFHEDGVRSALDVVNGLGVELSVL